MGDVFGRVRRKRRKRGRMLLACMGCGGSDLEKKRVFDGPVTYEHDTAESYVCRGCGYSGIPVTLYGEEEIRRFREGVGRDNQPAH